MVGNSRTRSPCMATIQKNEICSILLRLTIAKNATGQRSRESVRVRSIFKMAELKEPED
jgi:hypothetical protein